jgi:hypothetical protein
MPREAKESDFHVDVDGIGQFMFARRTMKDQYMIRGEYARLTGGHYDDEGRIADMSALGYATLTVLLVEGPKSFDVAALDPLLDDDFDKKILKIYSALRAKELSFRPGPATAGEGAGAGNGEHVRPVVPPEVQPPAV